MGKKQLRNIVVISDTHFGSQLGLFPLSKVRLDESGYHSPSPLQEKVAVLWHYFWKEWVPKACHGEPYALVINGDVLDGNHHNGTDQISHNLTDQARIAKESLTPIVKKLKGPLYIVRGTEAHAGKSAQDEERLAQELGAVPNEFEQYARSDLWLELGDGSLIHFLHHIGTASSNAYEATAVGRELMEEFNEAGRWKQKPPDVVVRSHRHRYMEVRVPTAKGYGISFVTAGWQLKTTFSWKIAGARISAPQIGGHVIRLGSEGLYTIPCVWTIDRSRTEYPTG